MARDSIVWSLVSGVLGEAGGCDDPCNLIGGQTGSVVYVVGRYDQLAGGEEEALRAHWYALLARLLVSEPDDEALAYCRALEGDKSTDLGQAVSTLASAARATNSEAIKDEFFNLFIGVGQGELLPFGSYYITGFLNEKPLARLRADMGQLGIARAEDDGVATGDNLCYRCKNGGRPQVMVFTRSSNEQVVKLVQKLDEALGQNSSKQLRAFVNVLGEDKSSAAKDAKKLAAASKAKAVPFVVPNEFENGPGDYGLNTKAAVTVILAEGGKVKANHAFASAKDVAVDSVIADLAKILN